MLFFSSFSLERAIFYFLFFFLYLADETMAIYIEKLDEFLKDEHDNSYKLTADYAMKLQFLLLIIFFCSLQIRQQRMMIYLGGGFLAIHLFHHLSHRFIPCNQEP